MLNTLIDVAVLVLVFCGGVVLGVKHPPQLDIAIKTIDQAEAQALAVVDKITSHKAA